MTQFVKNCILQLVKRLRPTKEEGAMKTTLIEMDFISQDNKYLNLKEFSIQDKSYHGAIFSGSRLESCLFYNVTFSCCTFYASNFDACDFKNCKFENCKFIFSYVSQTNFYSCTVNKCEFQNFSGQYNTLFNCNFDMLAFDTFFTDENDMKSCYVTDDTHVIAS